MITKVGKALLAGNGRGWGRKKGMLIPLAAMAALKMPKIYDASLSYVDPMDPTYYREPGIFYDELKMNPYYVHA